MLRVPEGVQYKAVLDGGGGGQELLSAQRKWLNGWNVNQNKNKETCVFKVVIVIHERNIELKSKKKKNIPCLLTVNSVCDMI